MLHRNKYTFASVGLLETSSRILALLSKDTFACLAGCSDIVSITNYTCTFLPYEVILIKVKCKNQQQMQNSCNC